MRSLMVAALALVLAGGPAHAMFMIPPPDPVVTAPIDRALANVASDKSLSEAERARLQGRLNLLAYVRDSETFPYSSSEGYLAEHGTVPCSSVQPSLRASDAPPPTFAPEAQCVRMLFDLSPIHEIPDGDKQDTASIEAKNRLAKAAMFYSIALDSEPGNLRALLGYAYALDRLGLKESAREQLREIIKRGLPKLKGEYADWEDHAVLSEAMLHLSTLAVTRADKRRVATLQKRLKNSRPPVVMTPMVVPLTDAPFARLHDPASPVAFDFAGSGDKRAQGWLTADAAWLVWDPRGAGKIESGFDLIGSATWAAFWRDGFQVLRALDDDRDGAVDGAELNGLALWRDANANGVSDAGEVKPVSAYGIVALATEGGGDPDLLIAPAGVRLRDGGSRPLYDWTPRAGISPNS